MATIEKRKSKDGKFAYYVKVRLKGHYGHHRSWQCGSFLPIDRLHKNSYTLTTRRG